MTKAMDRVYEIDLDDIVADEEFNCRGKITPIDVANLAKDISANGLISPVTVMTLDEARKHLTGKNYFLVAGFRRYTAHLVAKIPKIKALVIPLLSDSEARMKNLSENLDREDLTILQEAHALRNLYDVGVKETEVMKRLNKTRGWVQVRYMLLKLPEEIQNEVEAGFITQTQIRSIYTVFQESGKVAAFDVTRTLKDAKIKGLKRNIDPNSTKKKAKRIRNTAEIGWLMVQIQNQLGNGIHTRCLAWCSGNITNEELEEAFKEFAAKSDKTFFLAKS